MERTWWQLSFISNSRPEGKRWLGGVNVEAPTIADAITKTHLLGINPGGEIAFIGFFADDMDHRYVDRLITDLDEWRDAPTPTNQRPLPIPPQTANVVRQKPARSMPEAWD